MPHRTDEEFAELSKRIIQLGDTWKWVADLMTSFPDAASAELPVEIVLP